MAEFQNSNAMKNTFNYTQTSTRMIFLHVQPEFEAQSGQLLLFGEGWV